MRGHDPQPAIGWAALRSASRRDQPSHRASIDTLIMVIESATLSARSVFQELLRHYTILIGCCGVIDDLLPITSCFFDYSSFLQDTTGVLMSKFSESIRIKEFWHGG